MSVSSLPMGVCSCIDLSVLIGWMPFIWNQPSSEIEWSGLLSCLVNGSLSLLFLMLFLRLCM